MSSPVFPKGFLWGAATSAHQVEGNNHNDWSEWEHANSARLAAAAASRYANAPTRIPEYILRGNPSPLDPENYISGTACDHYNRFREDFDLAKSLGHNAHRFSIEWSRIEPEEGKFDAHAIAHYRDVLLALRERGMEPFVTLWHWTLPLWVRDIGGWENEKTIGYFRRYVEKVVRAMDTARFWLTVNEPMIYAGLSYIRGVQPPGVKSLLRANTVIKNLMRAHSSAYDAIHNVQPGAHVGLAQYLAHIMPYKNLPWNSLVAKTMQYMRNWRFLDGIKNRLDFIGVNYYHTDVVSLSLAKKYWWFVGLKNPNTWTNDLGWQIYPEGIYHVLKGAAARYKKPLYITENGVADARDVHREKFITEHLAWMHRAIQEGADVRGYFHWSLLDNFEIPRVDGFWPRFGLLNVDRKTLARTKRPSADVYAAIAKANALV